MTDLPILQEFEEVFGRALESNDAAIGFGLEVELPSKFYGDQRYCPTDIHHGYRLGLGLMEEIDDIRSQLSARNLADTDDEQWRVLAGEALTFRFRYLSQLTRWGKSANNKILKQIKKATDGGLGPNPAISEIQKKYDHALRVMEQRLNFLEASYEKEREKRAFECNSITLRLNQVRRYLGDEFYAYLLSLPLEPGDGRKRESGTWDFRFEATRKGSGMGKYCLFQWHDNERKPVKFPAIAVFRAKYRTIKKDLEISEICEALNRRDASVDSLGDDWEVGAS